MFIKKIGYKILDTPAICVGILATKIARIVTIAGVICFIICIFQLVLPLCINNLYEVSNEQNIRRRKISS